MFLLELNEAANATIIPGTDTDSIVVRGTRLFSLSL